METAQTISDCELLMVRQCKKNFPSRYAFKRIFGMAYALHPSYAKLGDINFFLMEICIKFNLIKDWSRFVMEEIHPAKAYWWSNNPPTDYDEILHNVLVGKISTTEVKIFPRYPNPAWFKNKYKNEDSKV